MTELLNDGLLTADTGRTSSIGGEQRIYRWGDYGLSLINSPMAHSYPFAWEAAVIKFEGDGDKFSLNYETPLSDDVEVFSTVKETNEFIAKARDYFTSKPAASGE
jgi:hypothetical protein